MSKIMSKRRESTVSRTHYFEDAPAMTKGTQEPASTPTEQRSGPRATPPPGAAAQQAANPQQPRVVSRPEDVAGLVLMQIDLVNARKDDLTIAIKGLSDLTRQLVRAYGENMQTIEQLQSKVRKLGGSEKPGGSPSNASSNANSSSNGKRKTSR
jgi:hypothetical protein